MWAFILAQINNGANYQGISTLITALGGFVMQVTTAAGVLVTLFLTWRSNQKIVEVKNNTDGMKTELMAMTERASKAEGEIKGRQVEGDKRDATAAVIAEHLMKAAPPSPPVVVAPAITVNNDKPVPVQDDKVAHAIKELSAKQDQVGSDVGDLSRKVDEAAEEGKPKEDG